MLQTLKVPQMLPSTIGTSLLMITDSQTMFSLKKTESLLPSKLSQNNTLKSSVKYIFSLGTSCMMATSAAFMCFTWAKATNSPICVFQVVFSTYRAYWIFSPWAEYCLIYEQALDIVKWLIKKTQLIIVWQSAQTYKLVIFIVFKLDFLSSSTSKLHQSPSIVIVW